MLILKFLARLLDAAPPVVRRVNRVDSVGPVSRGKNRADQTRRRNRVKK